MVWANPRLQVCAGLSVRLHGTPSDYGYHYHDDYDDDDDDAGNDCRAVMSKNKNQPGASRGNRKRQ